MRRLLSDIHRREPILTTAAWVSLACAAVCLLILMPLDDRTILGIDPWIKPAKFFLSFTIYFVTLACLLPMIEGAPRARRFVRWATLVALIVEMIGITGQAARGTTSHFNVKTPFDAVVFNLMGIFIAINTAAVVVLLWAFVKGGSCGDRAMRIAVILGIVLFLIGSMQGGMMVARNAHTVGAPDGGPGLPIVNWSTKYGDLRIAHALGLHAMQLLPLAALLLRRWNLSDSVRRGVIAMIAVIYTGAFIFMTMHALAGRALIALS